MQTKVSFYQNSELDSNHLRTWVIGFILLLFSFYTLPGWLWKAAQTTLNVLGFSSNFLYSFAFDNESIASISIFHLISHLSYTVPVLICIYLFQTKIRQKPFKDLVISSEGFRWSRIWIGFLLAGLILGLAQLLNMLFHYVDRPQEFLSSPGLLKQLGLKLTYDPIIFWTSLPFILFFIPINAFMQEIIFRGFIDKGLYKITGNIVIAFLISAMLFAVWHLGNFDAEFGKPFYLLELFIFSIAMSIITLLDNGTEMAIGAHTANNLFFYIVVGLDIPYEPLSWLFSSGEPRHTLGTSFAELAIWAIFIILFFGNLIKINIRNKAE